MPELPEVEAIAEFLGEQVVGYPIRRIDVGALSVLKTFDPAPRALVGATITRVHRTGKYLIIDAESPEFPRVHLVVHLSRAGWLRWSEALSAVPPKPGGKSPLALRVHCGPADADGGGGFDVTEAGTQKRLAVWIVRDLDEIEYLRTLGPDVLSLDAAGFAKLVTGSRAQLKNLLRDQRLLAGIGNAYSDEILHTARLSPFALGISLDADTVARLFAVTREVLDDAVRRSVGQGAATLKAEKRSGMRVHGRTGQACPVCGDVVREVSFADRSFQYCPTCQTGGKVLADRRLSKLLK